MWGPLQYRNKALLRCCWTMILSATLPGVLHNKRTSYASCLLLCKSDSWFLASTVSLSSFLLLHLKSDMHFPCLLCDKDNIKISLGSCITPMAWHRFFAVFLLHTCKTACFASKHILWGFPSPPPPLLCANSACDWRLVVLGCALLGLVTSPAWWIKITGAPSPRQPLYPSRDIFHYRQCLPFLLVVEIKPLPISMLWLPPVSHVLRQMLPGPAAATSGVDLLLHTHTCWSPLHTTRLVHAPDSRGNPHEWVYFFHLNLQLMTISWITHSLC